MEEQDLMREQAQVLADRAYRHQMNGELGDAIALYRRSIAMFPTAEAHTFLGWAYSMMNRYEEAIAECEKAITVDPLFGNPYNDIGAYLIEKGEYDEAIPWFERAIRAKRYESPAFPHLNLGRVYEKKGEWQKAIECYKQALTLNPNYALAKRSLGRLISSMN